jgi:hypothetical protein
VLYIDGEMSSTLMQRRIIDALGRAGGIDHPENPHFVCLNDLPTRPPPLNTEAGQKYMDNVIDDCGSEFLFLDNIQALLSGDMKDEEPWRNVLPWIYSLTKRKIGQAWVHHTGHDETHSYGSSTREWQLDAVGLLERLSDGPGDIGFKLRFTKARERTPENREDYEAKIIRLVDNQWSAEPVERQGGMSRQAAKSSKPKSPSPLATKFYDALIDALAHTGERRQDSAGLPSATDDQWRGELCRLGLVPEGDDKVTQHSRRSLISKYRRELIAANWIACNGELSWSIREGGR